MGTLAAWKTANPEKAKVLQDGIDRKMPTVEEMFAAIPEQEPGSTLATRVTGAQAMQGVAKACPLYVSGSADLHGSNKNYIKGGGDFGNPEMPAGGGKTYAGRNIHYGIREHAMGSIMNGIAYYGIFRNSGATFLVFADYLRAPIRVAALSELPVGYYFTHDSIGVGEDGPTHQPVETVPDMSVASVAERRFGVLKGAYIMKKETAALEVILIATGSEVQHAVKAAEQIGAGARVVS